MNDTLIFFVLAALALVIKWLTSRSESKRAESEKSEADPSVPNEQAPPQRPPPQSEEERVRRFLEALGMPPGTQPPPPVRRRRVVTASPPPAPPKAKVKRSWAQPLPPLVTTPEDLRPPPVQPAPPPLPTVVTVAPSQPEIGVAMQPATLSPSTVVDRTASRQPAPTGSLGATLRSRGSVRRAIILREVLGPPRGLEPFAV